MKENVIFLIFSNFQFVYLTVFRRAFRWSSACTSEEDSYLLPALGSDRSSWLSSQIRTAKHSANTSCCFTGGVLVNKRCAFPWYTGVLLSAASVQKQKQDRLESLTRTCSDSDCGWTKPNTVLHRKGTLLVTAKNVRYAFCGKGNAERRDLFLTSVRRAIIRGGRATLCRGQ